MSVVYPLIDGWVGYGDGKDVLLRSDEPLESDHPLVRERPELFTPPKGEILAPRRGRTVASRGRGGADG